MCCVTFPVQKAVVVFSNFIISPLLSLEPNSGQIVVKRSERPTANTEFESLACADSNPSTEGHN